MFLVAGWEYDLAKGVTLGEGMRVVPVGGDKGLASEAQCPAENPSCSQEVFPPLVPWEGGEASRKEDSWGKQGPQPVGWRRPRPGSWAGVPLTLQEGWNTAPRALGLGLWWRAGLPGGAGP